MANVAISGLPEQTGKTDNDVLAIVDSGETTTSKIKVSTLLDGVGGNLLTSNGTDSFRTPQYATTDTAGDGQLIIGGSGSTITNTDANCTIIGARGNVLSDGTDGMIMLGGWQNNLSSIGGNSRSSIAAGGYGNNCTGRRNFTSGILNTNSSDSGGILAGASNNLSGTQGAIIGGQSNTASHTGSVVLGGSSQSTSIANEVVVPNLTITNYASLNFADDTAAAAGGIILGQVYHNAGALRVRIV